MLNRGAPLWLLVVGFFGCHVSFEALNESLVNLPQVPKSITLWSVAVQFALCALLPLLRQQSSWVKSPWRSWWPFVAISAMVFLSNSLSQYATHYVEFSLKIVAKSSKLMPTMLISGLLGNSGYFEAMDYMAAILLCAGTALFSYGQKTHVTTTASQVALGMSALGLSCIFDGLVPNVQQRVLRETTPAELMARTNAVGAVAGVISIALSDVSSVLDYADTRPWLWLLILGIGLSLAGSVLCYTDLVARAGSVFAVGIATLRKSTSLLLSYVLFPGKSFDKLRQLGLICIALGLFLAERRARSKEKMT